MGILQGSSTQTDWAVSFWMVCFVSSALSMATVDCKEWTQRLTAGGGLGLALLTKATAYIFAIPFAIWLGARRLRSRLGPGLLSLGIVAAIAIAANLGFYLRNVELNGSPLGLGQHPPWRRRHHQLSAVFGRGRLLYRTWLAIWLCT